MVMTPVAIADVHRPGLAQFLEEEKVKSGEAKVQIVEGATPVRSRQKEELLVAIRDNRIVIGVDEALVNGHSPAAAALRRLHSVSVSVRHFGTGPVFCSVSIFRA